MKAAPRLRAAAVPVVLAAIAWSGCSKVHPPVAPPIPPDFVSPLVSVAPPERARWVSQYSSIWARFDVPFDTTTVTPSTVYFKTDGKRINTFLSWQDSATRLTLAPAENLILGRTYTIEISPRVLRTDGTPLFPGGWFWQFTVTSILELTTPDPADSSVDNSPLMRLKWTSTPASAGPVTYHVFTSTDSAAVAGRVVPAAAVTSLNTLIPRQKWPMDTTNFWAVRAVNGRTGQVLEGPTWKFRTVASDAQADSLILRAQNWGISWEETTATRCFQNPVPAGPNVWTAIKWQVPNYHIKVKSISWQIAGNPPFTDVQIVQLKAAASVFDPCQVRWQQIPLPSGSALATARRGPGNTYLFRDDVWAAQFEASARDNNNWGYLVTSIRGTVLFNFSNPRTLPTGAIVVYYYPEPLP